MKNRTTAIAPALRLCSLAANSLSDKRCFFYYVNKYTTSTIFGTCSLLFQEMAKTVKDYWHRIGQKIREARKKMGLTQEELAEKADVHYTFLGAAERGETNLSLKTLFRVADALSFPPQTFSNSPKEQINRFLLKKRLNLANFSSFCENRTQTLSEKLELWLNFSSEIDAKPKEAVVRIFFYASFRQIFPVVS